MLILRNFLRSNRQLKYSCNISAPFCNQFRTYATIKPVKIAYTDYNKNASAESPIIVIHGLFGSRGNWQSICKALERKLNPPRRIIAVDVRNHGSSEHSEIHNYEALAIDFKQLLQQLNINKVCFIAHSMGGRAAMLFSLQHPEKVEHLFVVDISPTSNSKDLSHMYKYFKAMREAPFVNGTLSQVRIAIDKHLSKTIENKSVRAFLLTNLVEIDGKIKWRINLEALENNYEHIATFPIATNSGYKYNGPVTFIKGALSDYIQTKDYEMFKQLFPNATIEIIEDAGHWLHADRPTEFQEIILRQLKQNK